MVKAKLNDHKGAITDYTKSIWFSEAPTIRQLTLRCKSLGLLRQYNDAIKDCDQSIEIQPVAYTLSVRADIKKSMGDIEGACKDWRESKMIANNAVSSKAKADTSEKIKENCS